MKLAMLIGAPPPLHGRTIPLSDDGTPGRLVFPGVGTFLWIGKFDDERYVYAYEKGSKP